MKYKIVFLILISFVLLISGCTSQSSAVQIIATTRPVFEFTNAICEGTTLSVAPLITESVSCLHDYSLSVNQVRSAEAAELIICSGAGLEDFMDDILSNKPSIDSSIGITLLQSEDDEGEYDPHIWLSPYNAVIMVQNIRDGLSNVYPSYGDIFYKNAATLISRLNELQENSEQILSPLKTREIITFHDGFSYFADSFQLRILETVEEESGSEASAQDLVHLICLVQNHNLPAVFTEKNGSPSAASIISAETGAKVYALDMGMSGPDYFDSMYQNIYSIKEALG